MGLQSSLVRRGRKVMLGIYPLRFRHLKVGGKPEGRGWRTAFQSVLERPAIALHFMHYNFCRVHKMLRVTPGVDSRIMCRHSRRTGRITGRERGERFLMADTTFPKEVYGVFCGGINQDTAHKITTTIGVASNGGVEHIHLLFQSTGGTINEGIYLHNLFKSLPLKLTVYNVGQVSSIAAVAYLGAQSRKASASAVFMLHKSTNTAQGANAALMGELSKALAVDDGRTEGILRQHLSLPRALWTKHKHHDLYLSADESIKYGLAQEIGDFAPPFGTKIFSIS